MTSEKKESVAVPERNKLLSKYRSLVRDEIYLSHSKLPVYVSVYVVKGYIGPSSSFHALDAVTSV
jgi:hypothetical protein